MIALLVTPLRAQRRWLRLAVLCAVLAAFAGVGLLAVSGWFLAGAALAGTGGIVAVQAFNYLLPSAAIRAAAITRTGARHGERLLGHRAALHALAEVRTTLFGQVARAALGGHDAGRSGLVANRLGRDVDALEDAVIRRVAAAGAGAGALAGLAGTVALGWQAVPVMLAALVLMRLVGRGMAARMIPAASARTAAAHADMQADYADIAGPAADIAVYGLGPAMTAALDATAARRDEAALAIARAEAAITATQTAIAAVTLTVLALVAHVSAPLLALGLLAAAAGLETWAGLVATDLRRHQVEQAEERLLELGRDSDRVAPPAHLTANPALSIAGRTFAPGTRLRIGGPSGAGKTRLVETLVGLRGDAPQDLAVDGKDPRGLGLGALRSIFSLAGQDVPLIAGSIADNLRLARPGTNEDEMWAALRIACIDDVVRTMAGGLDEWLGGEGARLSGGQKRRLVLARALLAERPWLVLDEPSEGLDAATEALLVERLRGWLDTTGAGLVLVSHRPAMSALATQVVEVQPLG
ncbi:ABC transporter related protein [Novosphingobium nitrogenifigens DSM 19370]|uniref:ABC transporter related protein n=1 Tax=Novosphingobium nitrogenifigens DSM 19370 TaxID=983920 RepID=F1Z607_9SPHN|nr:ATP-binding cassette domain-containing protein [Novosphingobium nitrogenifigens]EGD59971.1 ABC transporter related protein [Novosphingobium nitrogenifigens DSM 19370]